MRSQLHVI